MEGSGEKNKIVTVNTTASGSDGVDAVQVKLPEELYYTKGGYTVNERYFPTDLDSSSYPTDTELFNDLIVALYGTEEADESEILISSVYGEYYNGVNRSTFNDSNDFLNEPYYYKDELMPNKFKGIHEGIDITNRTTDNANISSLTGGIIVRLGKERITYDSRADVASNNLDNLNVETKMKMSANTVSVYYSDTKETIIYQHLNLNSDLKLGQEISSNTLLGTETDHVHVEFRDGVQTNANLSAKDLELKSKSPYDSLRKILY